LILEIRFFNNISRSYLMLFLMYNFAFITNCNLNRMWRVIHIYYLVFCH